MCFVNDEENIGDEIMEKQKPQISKVINAPIIVAIIGAVLTVFLSMQKAELRYTLSEEIPISLTNENIQNVQQLLIKNTGDISAEKIVININGKIEKYSIICYSKMDVVEEFLEANSLQLVYPELPKQGTIQITFISEQQIEDTDIEIKYNKGLAEEALSSGVDAGIFTILCYVIFFALIIIGVYRIATDFNVKYYYQKYLKRRKKFWYINNERWENLRKDSIVAWQRELLDETIKLYNVNNITKTKSFMILNEKPEYLLSDEWEDLRDTATEAWEILQGKFLYSWHFDIDTEFREFLRIEKPVYLEEKEWKKERKAVIEMIKFSHGKHYDKEGIEKAYLFLNQKREIYFKENEWQQLVDIAFSYLKSTFYLLLNKVKEYEVEKLEKYFLMKRPLFADEEEWRKMQADIYDTYVALSIGVIKDKVERNYFSGALELMGRPCPANLPKEYWKQYLEYSKNIVESQLITYIYESGGNSDVESVVHSCDLSMLNYNRIDTVLYDVLSEKLLLKSIDENIDEKSMPEWVRDRKLFKLEKYLLQKGKLEEILVQTELEKTEVDKLKERVTKQLKLIDSVLKDANAVDYVEDYCDTFSKGNFENLKKIARIIKRDSEQYQKNQ